MALISKNKPLSPLFDFMCLFLAYGWFKVLTRIYKHGIEHTISNLSFPAYLFLLGQTFAIYFYFRNKLIAWHIEFSTNLTLLIIALTKTFFFQGNSDMRVVVASVAIVCFVESYMIFRYRAYSDYVKDMTNSA
jgi:hypothetical protein